MASTISTTATIPPATETTATAAVMERSNFLCNSCNGDFSPDATATNTGLRCPHCNSRISSDNYPNPNQLIPSSSESSLPSFVDASIVDPSMPTTFADSTRTFPFSNVTASDDNFRLDSPYLQRLIHHLTHSNDSSPSTATTSTTISLHHSPTSKSAIEAIPMVKITSALLDIDPIVLCAVCKDQFVIDDETKQLPCKHMYHPDCILPWLSQHNSCPVCRFQLPKEPTDWDVKVRRRSRSRVMRLEDLTEDVDDEAMLGIGFSNLHHQHLLPEISPEVMFPLTHIGQTVEVDVLPDSEQANGLENVSGWPNWHVYGGENGVNAGWVDEADVAMP